MRGREPVRTTGGQGGSARPSPAGPESTARPGSAHPKSLASSPLHSNGCFPETGPECVHKAAVRAVRLLALLESLCHTAYHAISCSDRPSEVKREA